MKGLEERLKADREMPGGHGADPGELMTEAPPDDAANRQVPREKLSRSRNERESNAAQREVEELRKLLRDREDEIERLNNATNAARAAIDDADGKRTAIAGDLAGTAPGITTSLSELEAERDASPRRRAKVVAKLPTHPLPALPVDPDAAPRRHRPDDGRHLHGLPRLACRR